MYVTKASNLEVGQGHEIKHSDDPWLQAGRMLTLKSYNPHANQWTCVLVGYYDWPDNERWKHVDLQYGTPVPPLRTGDGRSYQNDKLGKVFTIPERLLLNMIGVDHDQSD